MSIIKVVFNLISWSIELYNLPYFIVAYLLDHFGPNKVSISSTVNIDLEIVPRHDTYEFK